MDLFPFLVLSEPTEAPPDELYEEAIPLEHVEPEGPVPPLSQLQLVEQARDLSLDHRHVSEQRGHSLLWTVRSNARLLARVYRRLADAAGRRERLTAASEWLLDNYHIVEQQLTDIRKHLPSSYYAELPKLTSGTLAGLPRVYSLAQTLVTFSDATLNEHALRECVSEYQVETPLRIGELWAVPIMLRVALIEYLAKLVAPLDDQRRARLEADRWADRILEAAEHDPAEVLVVLGELARKRRDHSGQHIVRLFQRLRGRGTAVMPVMDFLCKVVGESAGCDLDEYVSRETQLQAAAQVSISNVITSFRLLDRIAWDTFFDETSLVEATLRGDPVYAASDFGTRDRCRHRIEKLARRCRMPETAVAAAALDLPAQRAVSETVGTAEQCAQYYLIDSGLPLLENTLRCGPTLAQRCDRLVFAHPTVFHFGFLGSVTLILVWAAVRNAWAHDAAPLLCVLAGLVSLLPASDVAVSLFNWLVTRTIAPRVLPKLDYTRGIPDSSRTLVAVPTLLTSPAALAEVLEHLEIHYLANSESNLLFALVTDYTDATKDEMPSDEELLRLATEGIERLNERHCRDGVERFLLFHRKRLWNPGEGCWMGWERKRGKLMELNRVLRGATDTSFTDIIGDRSQLPGVRFVLTLDSDTRLPPESARRLVATLAHPLNSPVIDPERRVVVRGYGILQPRVSLTLTSAARSWFTRVFSGNAGVDPYTTAVSDAYQDLFGEGVFCGKGLYDVDAFEAVLRDRVGTNELLSHDLFEGSFARCALVTDVEVFDDYPASYATFAARQHRWIRGDWQLLRWLFPRVRVQERSPDGEVVSRLAPTPLSPISRWKIFDNLRRSLMPLGVLLFLICAWTVLPVRPWTWTLIAMGALAFPIVSHLAGSVLVDPRAVLWRAHFWTTWSDFRVHLQQVALSFVLLAHQVQIACDGIIRTLWRMFVSRRNLLEWQTAAESERRLGVHLKGFLSRMGPSALGSGALMLLIGLVRPEALAPSMVFLVPWTVSPFVAYWVSRPIRKQTLPLSATDRRMLRLVARRTWRFFEEFVTEQDQWLPPDNYQPDRLEPIAHRTSPTNMGLSLLAVLSARDLGYVGLQEMVERLERTLGTMGRMERFRGHFYNWYETLEATPILPLYISTVDSGNLAGHLLALKQGCLELCESPLIATQWPSGIRDTLRSLRSNLASDNLQAAAKCAACMERLEDHPTDWVEWHAQLLRLQGLVDDLVAATTSDASAGAWALLLRSQIAELIRDVDFFLPWLSLLDAPPANLGNEGMALTQRSFSFEEKVTFAGEGVAGPGSLVAAAESALEEVGRLRDRFAKEAENEAVLAWLAEMEAGLTATRDRRLELQVRLRAIAATCSSLAEEMDFTFLYDESLDLFSVGYDTSNAQLDRANYDLLASECRLASFFAIAKGDVPQKHWFRLGRSLTIGFGERALVSWGGTMFEYLMPLLVMRAHEGSLLAESLPSVVRWQRRYGKRERLPWGVSEAAYAGRDPAKNYQYRTFGAPGLGLKQDLFEDAVVAPYATMLALPVAPAESVRNLEALAKEGLECEYGFYESIDYTPERVPRGSRGVVVKTLMAHHQGMSLVSIANALNANRMQDRFHADPLVKAVELLLEERSPIFGLPAHPETQHAALSHPVLHEAPPVVMRHFTTAQTSSPRVQLLSNRTYSTVLTVAGSGYSTWGGLALTRWREDVTRDHWGQFVYLRDVRTNRLWSIADQPMRPGGSYEVYFAEDKAEFYRIHNGIRAHLEVTVSAEDNAEVRRVTLTNTGENTRELEITSYAEVVLSTPAADQAHTTFSNLFVETEYVPESNALLATRRPRSAKQSRAWMAHVLAHEGLPAEIWRETDFETDRSRFLGRGRTAANPLVLEQGNRLSRTVGAVLDPIFSIQQRVILGPGQTVQLAFSTVAANTREEVLGLAERYQDLRIASRTFELSWTHAQIELLNLNLTGEEARTCQRLASRLLYVDPFVRPAEDLLVRNSLKQSGLWAFGISGDLPIVLAVVSANEHLDLVRDLVVAHTYLRRKGLTFDLVILNEHPPSYLQSFEEAIQAVIHNEGAPVDQPGGVFLRRAELISDAGRVLLQFVARSVFNGRYGSLLHQLDWRPTKRESIPRLTTKPAPPIETTPTLALPPQFFNGLGGFDATGTEYVIVLKKGEWPPAPWSNVVANERFGFVASEAGTGFTWSENSRENRLTPWTNDPVSDPVGEAIYVRNEKTGKFWSATPLPASADAPYKIAHGPGYSRYEVETEGLKQSLVVFVPPNDPVKIYRLHLRNQTGRSQDISATFYAEWVLGFAREQTQWAVFTSLDQESGALFARNSYNPEFSDRVAFADVDDPARTWTADRVEFLGRNGSPQRPLAMTRERLGGAAGVTVDPCAALQVKRTIPAWGEAVVYFVLGEGADMAESRRLVAHYRDPANARHAYGEVLEQWQKMLGSIQVRTPDPTLDLLLNRWLLYQVIACRVWARSAFYQSGGAYGFRDQLQDVMAAIASGSPEGASIARAQILLHAAHQFEEGDVQHWWHPPSGRGIRTRFSDDLLWLPYVTAYYVNATGDVSVLDERVPFIVGRLLAEQEDEYYDLPTVSDQSGTVYEHCLRAIRRGTTWGVHDLPLMGTGDWNDGMNLVGNEGQGESVWVAWFLISLMESFAPLCRQRGDNDEADAMSQAIERYKAAIEKNAWDGGWYRRAYFDNGQPLGSKKNDECKIDSLAQTWGVISGAAPPARAKKAMAAVEEHLVREQDSLILLFTPPFDEGKLDPGYIKGYVPGVRENGGQYTHAALWVVMATAMMGHGDRAHELFTLLNPIGHTDSPEKVEVYKGEPYVIAADVYGVPPHVGRGGWTWYTGSASWMYRIGLENLLGFRLLGDAFTLEPCIPHDWPGFDLTYRANGSTYEIRVENPDGVCGGVASITLNGEPCTDGRVPLQADGGTHQVEVVMGV